MARLCLSSPAERKWSIPGVMGARSGRFRTGQNESDANPLPPTPHREIAHSMSDSSWAIRWRRKRAANALSTQDSSPRGGTHLSDTHSSSLSCWHFHSSRGSLTNRKSSAAANPFPPSSPDHSTLSSRRRSRPLNDLRSRKFSEGFAYSPKPLNLGSPHSKSQNFSPDGVGKGGKKGRSVSLALLQNIPLLHLKMPFFKDLLKTTTGSWAHPGREGALATVHRHLKGKNRILASYRQIKNAMKDMQDQYVSSKDTKNVIGRYSLMKKMIREVTIYERQYWTLIDLPKQNLSESQADYIGRVLTTLENRIDDAKPMSPTKPGLGGLFGTQAVLANQAKEAKLLETLKSKSADELRKETANLQAEMCKLIKKYLGLRVLVTQLHNDFESSKNYPIVPRYTLLKDMIKNVLRDPSFSEICHEIEED